MGLSPSSLDSGSTLDASYNGRKKLIFLSGSSAPRTPHPGSCGPYITHILDIIWKVRSILYSYPRHCMDRAVHMGQHTREYGPYGPYIAQHTGIYGPHISYIFSSTYQKIWNAPSIYMSTFP